MKHHYFGEIPTGYRVVGCDEHGDSLVSTPWSPDVSSCPSCAARQRREAAAREAERQDRLRRVRERRKRARG